MTRLSEEIKTAIAGFRIKEDGEWILPEAALEDATNAAAEVAKRYAATVLNEYQSRLQEVLQRTGQLSNCDIDMCKTLTTEVNQIPVTAEFKVGSKEYREFRLWLKLTDRLGTRIGLKSIKPQVMQAWLMEYRKENGVLCQH